MREGPLPCILVASPFDDLVEFLARLLYDDGHEIIRAFSGGDVTVTVDRSKLDGFEPRLVLLDGRIEYPPAPTVIRHIAGSHWSHVPILLFSGTWDYPTAMSLGATAWQPCPFNPGTLLRVVATAANS